MHLDFSIKAQVNLLCPPSAKPRFFKNIILVHDTAYLIQHHDRVSSLGYWGIGKLVLGNIDIG